MVRGPAREEAETEMVREAVRAVSEIVTARVLVREAMETEMVREVARADLTKMAREITVRADLAEMVRILVREEPAEVSQANLLLMLRYRPSRPAAVRTKMPTKMTGSIRETG